MEPQQNSTLEKSLLSTKRSQGPTKKKISPLQEQYYKAIAMTSAELGAAIKAPTERIARHVGTALAHEVKAKNERDQAQRVFETNIAFYYEVKQRLLNSGYRTDVDGGKDRTPEENEKNFGAPNWAAYNEKCAAYSLKQADRKLRIFAKANGLLTDEGENIDDPGSAQDHETKHPRGRRREDPTAQKRYEFIATAAMELANKNPEGGVEKQILAAAENEPAPLLPVPPDLFAELLGFVTRISSSAADDGIRLEATALMNRMHLHQPLPAASDAPAEVAKEEKRKRDMRLNMKNGGPLRGAIDNQPDATSGHVQRSEEVVPAVAVGVSDGSVPAPDSESSHQPASERTIASSRQERPVPIMPAAIDVRDMPVGATDRRSVVESQVKMTKTAGASAKGQPDLVKSADPTKPYCVREQRGFGGSSLFAVVRVGNGTTWRTYKTERETQDVCESLNASRDAAELKKTDLEPPKRSGSNLASGPAEKPHSTQLARSSFVPPSKCAPPQSSSIAPAASTSVPQTGEADQGRSTVDDGQQPPRAETATPVAKAYLVKSRSKPGFPTDYLIVREGDKLPFEVFDTKEKADAACEKLNAVPLAGIILPEINSQSASQGTA